MFVRHLFKFILVDLEILFERIERLGLKVMAEMVQHQIEDFVICTPQKLGYATRLLIHMQMMMEIGLLFFFSDVPHLIKKTTRNNW